MSAGQVREVPDVRNRMVVAVVALMGVFVSTYLLLYKLGAFGTILCGTGGCEVVQNSPWAYFLSVPVAGWGLVGYLTIFAIALAGIQPNLATRRWVSTALLGLTGVALGFSIYLSALEEFVIGAWCQWCIASAILSVLAFGFSLPEGLVGRLAGGSPDGSRRARLAAHGGLALRARVTGRGPRRGGGSTPPRTGVLPGARPPDRPSSR